MCKCIADKGLINTYYEEKLYALLDSLTLSTIDYNFSYLLESFLSITKTLQTHKILVNIFYKQVRIMFEVQDLKFATLATVSRCGMVWFSEDVLSTDMIFENYLQTLRHVPLDESEEDVRYMSHGAGTAEGKEEEVSPTIQVK